MNIALIHLGNKGGTYHYSKSHIDYLNPKLIVGTRKFKKDDENYFSILISNAWIFVANSSLRIVIIFLCAFTLEIEFK